MSATSLGPVNFSQTTVEANNQVRNSNNVSQEEDDLPPSGNCQLGGSPLHLADRITPDDQRIEQLMAQFRGTPLPLAEQIMAGLDPEMMNDLLNQCNRGGLSISDLEAEIMILVIKNAFDNKCTEREMRAQLAQIQFQNGMKIADMIKQKGELAYKRAVTDAVTKLAACVGSITAEYGAKKLMNRPRTRTDVDVSGKGTTTNAKVPLTDVQKQAIQAAATHVSNLVKTSIETIGNLMCAADDKKMSELEVKQKIAEVLNKLVDSIASAVESSIRSQEQAIQFALGVVDKIFSLAASAFSSITNNIRA
ncbi:MAG: hypothetical protein LBS71_02745 [Puniceicoccales bacterium]|jgi:hypothetical protein|nr:hypothetical protein [Puniceicoccales bacterium]